MADSDSVLSVYAAPEWDELSEDGRRWVVALVREARADVADLLKALEWCVGRNEESLGDYPRQLKKARAAIAKARRPR